MMMGDTTIQHLDCFAPLAMTILIPLDPPLEKGVRGISCSRVAEIIRSRRVGDIPFTPICRRS